MPDSLHRCVSHVMGKGQSESSAYAICRTTLGLKSDGTEDAAAPDLDDADIRARTEIALQFQNGPSLIKEMAVCGPMGTFVNGDQRGKMPRSRLAAIAERFKQFRRQVPIFMLGDHPEDNDSATPVGWVEGLKMLGDDLMARVKLFGAGAAAVGGDIIRGASIYTVQGKNYDGSSQGEVLKHLLLTNEPYYKNLNVAATHDGDQAPVCVFTAFDKEAVMAAEDVKAKDEEITRLKDEIATLKAASSDEALTAKLKETETLLQEKIREVAELVASNENLKADVEKFRSPKAVEEMKAQLKTQGRQLRAMKIRDKVKRGVNAGQFNVALVGHPESGYDHESDEMVLSWFKGAPFKDSMDRLDIMLETMPKITTGRTFGSGQPVVKDEVSMTEQDKEFIRSQGKDPDRVMAAMKAKDASGYAASTTKKE